jgi:phosphatidylglycerol:prolipoprotein diacylglycerol transferase
MIPYPHINPDLFRIGPFHVRWYGLMYVLGFLTSYFLIKHQEKTRPIGLSASLIQDLLFYLAIGLLAGGRLGYILFYQYMNLSGFVGNPLEIIAVWRGGMSFHGGLIGTVVAGWWFCRRKGLRFPAVADRVIVTVPIALGLGRIGNFINGELFGRPSDVPWAMVFPQGGPLPRHPSQLYEALMEGAILFVLLWLLRRTTFRDGMMIGFFLFFYGAFRFFLEFFREPDAQLGFVLGPLTMGQILSIGMILCAVSIAILTKSQQDPNKNTAK